MTSSREIHLCVPVLRRYDLLGDLLHSLVDSTIKPHMVHVIDNGRNPDRLVRAMRRLPPDVKTDIFIPNVPMGVAESWNWFITHTEDERLLVNDDVAFAPESLERLFSVLGDLVSGLPSFVTGTRGHAFSCFLLRDSCVERVGLFDESISPGYAYFEDCDYEQRMYDAGIMIEHVECGVVHAHSATLTAASAAERNAHHERFLIAQQNFINKWGRLPRGVEQA